MKSILLLLAMLLLVVSCGEKGEKSKTKFNLKIGNLVSNPETFTGGLLVMGRRTDGSQKFTLSLTSDLNLTLTKGAWQFATIGWYNPTTGTKMSGNHICSFQQVEVRDDQQNITFNMSPANCVNAQGLLGEAFSDSQYLNIIAGTGTIGFKALTVNDCFSVDIITGVCSQKYGSSTIGSFKVSIPANVVGIEVANVQDLTSTCQPMSFSYGTTNLTLPVGGANGFIRTNLTMYDNADCSGAVVFSHSYPHGFAEAIANQSMLSPNYDAALANSSFYFKGLFTAGGTVPTAGAVKGDIYLIDGADVSVPPTMQGDYVFYNGVSWQTMYSSSVQFSNGKFYHSYNANNLFIAY